jgi:hypothetical protein
MQPKSAAQRNAQRAFPLLTRGYARSLENRWRRKSPVGSNPTPAAFSMRAVPGCYRAAMSAWRLPRVRSR